MTYYTSFFIDYICNLWESAIDWFSSWEINTKITIILSGVYLFLILLTFLLKKLFLSIHTYAMKKRNILLLKESFSEIQVTMVEKNFSFIMDLSNDIKESIEERNSDIDLNSDVFQKRLEYLKSHYIHIRDKELIDIPQEILSPADLNYILDVVLTQENIQRIFDDLNKKRKRNDPEIAFIGNKIGLYEYKIKGDKMEWKCYKSDHFTWKIFKELYLIENIPGQDIAPRQFFDELCIRLEKNKHIDKYRNVLMHTLCYLFSSMGIDLLLIGKNNQRRTCCLASLRSAKIDKSHITRIHVSVDESFSDTDQIIGGVYSVEEWVYRGIEEEIGIPIEKLKSNSHRKWNRTKIKYTDFSIVLGYGEIGLSGMVNVDNIEECLFYPGMDKSLESDGMFLIPMPSFRYLISTICSPVHGVQKYVASHVDNPMALFPWVEFAPPIYYRSLLRKLKFNISLRTFLLYNPIISSLFASLYNLYKNGNCSMNMNFTLLIHLACISLVFLDYLRQRITTISMWVPLWNGNVTILQSTGRIVSTKEQNTNNGLFMKTKASLGTKIPINDIWLKESPLCSVRRSLGRDEAPISFYNVCPNPLKKDLHDHKLKFLSIYYEDNCIYYYSIFIKNKSKDRQTCITYSFDFGMYLPKTEYLEFNKTLDKLDINQYALSCYFKMNNLNENGYSFCNMLPENVTKEYQLYDLFKYKNSFYWSCCHKNAPVFKSHEIQTLLSNLYYSHRKNHNTLDEFLLWDKISETRNELTYQCEISNKETVIIKINKILAPTKIKFEKQINQLIKRSIERNGGKMNELEILALQYILVRDGIFIGNKRYSLLNKLPVSSLLNKMEKIEDINSFFDN